MWSESLASFLSSLMTLPRDSRTSYSGMNVLRSTPMPLGGRSRTCPMDAFTTKPSPRYLLIVLAFAGDSTITRSLPLGFFLAVAMYFASLSFATGPAWPRDGSPRDRRTLDLKPLIPPYRPQVVAALMRSRQGERPESTEGGGSLRRPATVCQGR